jgi:hypothetical protein
MSADMAALLLSTDIPDDDESESETDHEFTAVQRPTDPIFDMIHNTLCDWLATRQMNVLIACSRAQNEKRSRALLATLDPRLASMLIEFQISSDCNSCDESFLDPNLRSTALEPVYLTNEHSFSSVFA